MFSAFEPNDNSFAISFAFWLNGIDSSLNSGIRARPWKNFINSVPCSSSNAAMYRTLSRKCASIFAATAAREILIAAISSKIPVDKNSRPNRSATFALIENLLFILLPCVYGF